MKKFKVTGADPIRVVAEGGYITWVTTEWSPLHQRFHTDAYSKGCISEDMVKNTSQAEVDPSVINVLNNIALQKNEVETAIKKMVEKGNPDDFQQTTGKPKTTVITKLVGFRVTNSVRDEVWHKYQENQK